MNNALLKGILSFYFLFSVSIYMRAQDGFPSTEQVEVYQKAVGLLSSFKNDQAFETLQPLMVELTEMKKLDTPFGLRVQFRQAEALEKDQKDVEALIELRSIKTRSEKLGVWDVYGNAGIIMANLYEKIGRDSLCLMQLKDVQKAIHNHPEIDSLYPLFSVRYSSYHRIFANQDTALFYAQEVLRTAPLYGQIEETAVGHMLSGFLLRETQQKKALEHLVKAARIFKKIEDLTGQAFMMHAISRWYADERDFENALIYNDTAIASAYKSIDEGHEERNTLYYPLKARARIYKSLNNHDSAWHYLNKGYRLEVDYMDQTNNKAVIETEARFQDEKKSLKIEEQEREIQAERFRRRVLIAFGCLILLVTGLLALVNLRLRQANKKSKRQSEIILQKNKALSSSLETQMVLQGEVHHRVKNNLHVIISLLEKQAERISDPSAQRNLESMANRIYSMSAIHEILYQQEDTSRVSFREYVENLCVEFSNLSSEAEKPLFNLNIEEQKFNLETSMPIGIMLTELLTNSLKYANSDEQPLHIDISFDAKDDEFLFEYKDNGPGFPIDFLKEGSGGLGSYLLKSMARQLQGQTVWRNDQGAVFSLRFKEKV